ncbi:MAG TPA: hypothetical protein VGN42_17520 [Pirellulales bacterium]|jgi:hypothetical protein|nr:hypothetical protein [Pirellulales bacterium]
MSWLKFPLLQLLRRELFSTEARSSQREATDKSLGIPAFEWQTGGGFQMFLAAPQCLRVPLLCSARFHEPFTAPFTYAARLVLGQLICYGG